MLANSQPFANFISIVSQPALFNPAEAVPCLVYCVLSLGVFQSDTITGQVKNLRR